MIAGTHPAGGMAISDLHSSLSQEVLPSAALLAASLQPPRGLLGGRAAVRSSRSQARLDAARQSGSLGGSQAALHPGSMPAEPEAGSDPSEEGAVKAAAVTAGAAAGARHALQHVTRPCRGLSRAARVSAGAAYIPEALRGRNNSPELCCELASFLGELSWLAGAADCACAPWHWQKPPAELQA